jgi:hypothetical protein
LWQLQSKMAAVGGEGAYAARLERVVEARAGIEQRLQVGCWQLLWRMQPWQPHLVKIPASS